jgi:hypothetical protein
MISEIDVIVYQIMRHASEYTLPDRSHTTRNQRQAALLGRVVLAGSGNRTVSILQLPRTVESTWQEGPPKVRLSPALPGFRIHGVSDRSHTSRWL